MDNAIWANQFDNPDNVKAHYTTTGPEIWEQTEGKVDAVVMGCGTGGTLSGVGRFLKERRRDIQVIVSDPGGSVLYSHVKEGGTLAPGASMIEGVGIGRITRCFDASVVDDAVRVGDQEAVDEAYRLLREEGLFVGASAGLSVAGALQWARREGQGKLIVCNLCDTGSRYISRLYDRGWLQRQGLQAPASPAGGTAGDS
jgi:cysteine synthase A